MANTDQFPAVFNQLKRMLHPFAQRLVVQADQATGYALITPHSVGDKPKSFGEVQIKKAYVSYYFMPVYYFPGLLHDASPALKRRMQGKSCFNFTSVDQLETTLAELTHLTERGFQRFTQEYLR
jgi:hypothetical protein